MTAFDSEKITFFAKTDARGKEVSFGIRAKDRQRHMYVVGKTGMGKSTLLENMAAQDIQNGEGMAFIDPHGSAAETLLEYVPKHRIKDVVYFAPFDLDNPVAFNVMEDVGSDKRHLVVSGLMSTFKKIWVDAWSARMEYILTNALLALIEYPDTTLLSVNRLFSDKGYRKKVVEYIKDPAVKSFWVDEYAGYTERFTAEALPAIQNKIGQFTGNPLIRNIIGQPHSSFDIREMMDNKKILIMNLSKGLIGETNANLLGSMLTTRIYLAAMSRANLPVAEMKKMANFYFYVDEFQSFANATFANILSEARKYHLNLIIAHQYIEQMEEEVRSAVFGNVGTTVSFRVGPFDAEVLETVFAPRFEAADLVNLGFAQIYLTLMIDGIGSQPFSAQTLPPVEMPAVSCREMVIESSRKNYANKRENVEKLVAELHTPEVKVVPKKSFDKKPFNNSPQNKKPQSANQTNYQGKVDVSKSFVPVVKVSAQDSIVSAQSRVSFVKKEIVKKTPDDLRNILSKMSQNKKIERKGNSVSVSTKEEISKVEPEKVFTPQVRVGKVEEKSDLKNTLAEMLKKIERPDNLSTAQPVPVVKKTVQEIQPKKEIKQNYTPSSDYRKNNSSIRKVVVENQKNTQDRDVYRSESQASVKPQSWQGESRRQSPPLDSDKIKKMLRQSDSERSPFI